MPSSRREAAGDRSSLQAWVQQQTALNQIDTRLQTLEPQRTEQAQLRERNNQLARQIKLLIHTIEPEIADKQTQLAHAETLSTIVNPNRSPAVLGSGRTRLANPAGNPEAPAARATENNAPWINWKPKPKPFKKLKALTPLNHPAIWTQRRVDWLSS